RRLRTRIDVDALHATEVDTDTAIHDRRACNAVAASVDGRCDALLAREVDCGDDVVGRRAPRDEHRATVDHRVEHRPRLVVLRVTGTDQPALEPREIEGGRACRSHQRPAFLSVLAPAGAPRYSQGRAPPDERRLRRSAATIRGPLRSVSSK